MLDVKGLSVMLGGQQIVHPLDFTIRAGDWMMLIGPNGAGKSTLLNALAQGLSYQGSVAFDGQDVRRMKARERARRLALLSQRHGVGYAFTAEEVIRLGRYAQTGFLRGESGEDERRVQEAARLCGLENILHQSVLTLSGGELQRVFLAQVFAQDPRLLLLDEPANHLDLPFQRQIFELIEAWLRTPGRAVISVVHDLSLARRYGRTALLMDRGRVAAQGEAGTVLGREALRVVYGMDVHAWMQELLRGWEDK